MNKNKYFRVDGKIPFNPRYGLYLYFDYDCSHVMIKPYPLFDWQRYSRKWKPVIYDMKAGPYFIYKKEIYYLSRVLFLNETIRLTIEENIKKG